MPAGRPSKLTPEVIDAANEYLDGGYETEGDAFPSMVGMADTLDVVTKTLYNWGESNPEFLRILEKVNQRQHRVLLAKGIAGEFNPAICKLVLGKHGYHDTQKLNLGGEVGHKHTVEKVSDTDAWIAEVVGSGKKTEDQTPSTH